jgi:hypothetical protein
MIDKLDPKPIGSMYAIYGNIYHQYTPNVSIYTIHGSYGKWFSDFKLGILIWGREVRRDPQISTKIDRGPEKTGAPIRKLLAPQMNRFTMIQYSTGIFTIVQVAKD